MFIISSGQNYIARTKTGSYFVTTKISEAEKYNSKNYAASALVRLPKSFYQISSKWQIVDVNPCEPVQSSEPKNSTPLSDNKSEAPPSKTLPNIEKDLSDIFDELAQLNNYKKSYSQKLNEELAAIQEEVCDLYHYIELNNFNACDGYKAYKMLHDTLQKRRIIKDKIYILTQITDSCDVSKISKENKYYHNRTYKPRRLNQLF